MGIIKKDIQVTSDHVTRAEQLWKSSEANPPKAKEIIQFAFQDSEIDARSKPAKELLAMLAEKDINPSRAHQYQRQKRSVLKPEQEEYITNNAISMTWFECAKELFGPTIVPLSHEATLVRDFWNSLPKDVKLSPDQDDTISREWKPPKTRDRAISKITKYVLNGVDKDKLTTKDYKNIDKLIEYMHSYRLFHQINNYESQGDRELFESCFVRYTHDKDDLTQEEVDQYTVLSHEAILDARNQDRVERLQRLLDETTDNDQALTMTLIKAIGDAQKEHDSCIARQTKLLSELKQKRSDRISKQIKENASILNLVALWKEEESRQSLIKLANKERGRLKKELDNFASMDDLRAMFIGITEEEILNG